MGDKLHKKNVNLSKSVFLLTCIFLAILVFVQAYIYLKTDENILLSFYTGNGNEKTIDTSNKGFAIKISTLFEADEGIDVIINGNLWGTLSNSPVAVYLQKGDVLEFDSYDMGYCLIKLAAYGDGSLPKDWDERLIIEDERLRLPPVY